MDEIVAVVDKLLQNKCVSTKQHEISQSKSSN